jgi:hypothetical protein
MSGSDERPAVHIPTDPLEERLRRRLRIIAGGVFLALIVVLALVDTFGRPAGLQVSEVIFGSLLGALLLILGVEGAARLVKR